MGKYVFQANANRKTAIDIGKTTVNIGKSQLQMTIARWQSQ
jgi:hypothetical protein